jgi:microcystin-dependent protein
MTLPTNASKANLDSATDDPKLARPDLADLVDKFNDLLTHLNLSTITSGPASIPLSLANGGTGAATAAAARTNLGVEDATESAAGRIEIATQTEANNGTDDTRALTPAKLTNISPASVTYSTSDQILILDASDSSKLKRSTVTFIPAGSVVDFAGSSAPSGWLLCAGQAVSRTTYADLFTAIGTTFGVGDGSTTFNLPDLRGRVVAGKDDMNGTAASRLTTGGSGINGASLGASGGTQTHTLITAEMPAHTHSGGIAGGTEGLISTGGSSIGNTDSTGGGGAHQNTQPTLILNKIIKT